MKRFLAAAVSAALFLALPGCGRNEGIPVTDSDISADSFLESDMDSPSADVKAEHKVRKAAALSRNAARLWLLAGGELAAAADEAEGLAGVPKEMPFIGSELEPSIEDALSMKPDVILADRDVPGYANIRKALSDTDCEIIEVGTGSFEDYASSMERLTDTTGNTDAYIKYVEAVAERNERIITNALEAAHEVEVTVTQVPESSADLSDIKVSEEAARQHYKGRIPTYLVIRIGEENCRAVCNDDFICSMLNDFGMSNANKSGQQVVVWKMQDDSAADESSQKKDVTHPDHVSDGSTLSDVSSETESGIVDEKSGTKMLPVPDDSSVSDDSGVSGTVDTFAGEIDSRESSDAGRRAFDNLLANSPDFIFYIYEGNEKTAAANFSDLVKSCESWKNTYAVKSSRVYELPQNSFRYPPNEMWDMAYEYMYQTIYNL